MEDQSVVPKSTDGAEQGQFSGAHAKSFLAQSAFALGGPAPVEEDVRSVSIMRSAFSLPPSLPPSSLCPSLSLPCGL